VVVAATPARQVNPEFDPRLPEVYDRENTWGTDDDFFVDIARRGTSVLDLGCGTGRLTIALADLGLDVTGVDPNPASLAWARAKPGADRVRWIEGTARDAPGGFDVALMTSNVAAHIVADDEWATTLSNLRRAVVPGGVLAFDHWQTSGKAWANWTESASRGDYSLSEGSVQTWVEVDTVEDDVVTFTWVNQFSDGEFLTGRSALRFRSEGQLRASLRAAGFEVSALFGDATSTKLAVVAS
jgi:SAM-dependent methyltransferase